MDDEERSNGQHEMHEPLPSNSSHTQQLLSYVSKRILPSGYIKLLLSTIEVFEETAIETARVRRLLKQEAPNSSLRYRHDKEVELALKNLCESCVPKFLLVADNANFLAEEQECGYNIPKTANATLKAINEVLSEFGIGSIMLPENSHSQLRRVVQVSTSWLFQQMCLHSYGIAPELRNEFRRTFFKFYSYSVEHLLRLKVEYEDVVSNPKLVNDYIAACSMYRSMLAQSKIKKEAIMKLTKMSRVLVTEKQFEKLWSFPAVNFDCPKMRLKELSVFLSTLARNIRKLDEKECCIPVLEDLLHCWTPSNENGELLSSGVPICKRVAKETSIFSSLPSNLWPNSISESSSLENSSARQPCRPVAQHHSGLGGVVWDKKNQQWKARVYFGGKMFTKTFSAKKYGFTTALQLATELRRRIINVLKPDGKKPREHLSGVKGVYWHSCLRAWVCSAYYNGKRRTKVYTVAHHGYEVALANAISDRMFMEKQLFGGVSKPDAQLEEYCNG